MIRSIFAMVFKKKVSYAIPVDKIQAFLKIHQTMLARIAGAIHGRSRQ